MILGTILPHLPSITHPGLILLALLLTLRFLHTAMKNLYFHPLSSYPGPLLSRASILPHTLRLWSGTGPAQIHALHERYGPVVRIGPNHLSYTDVRGWRDIYGQHRQQDQDHHGGARNENAKARLFYENQTLERGVEPDTMLTAGWDEHARVRRALAGGFSEAGVRGQESVIAGYVDLLVRQLSNRGGKDKVDLVRWYNWTTFDVVGDLVFAESFECLERGRGHPFVDMVTGFVDQQALLLGMKYCGLGKLGVVRWVVANWLSYDALDEMRAILRAKLGRRLEVKEERGDLFEGLMRKREEWNLDMNRLGAEATFLATAGADSTASILSGATYLLLQNPESMERLKGEVRSSFNKAADITIASVGRLPYLLACLNEALRRFPPGLANFVRDVHGGGEVIAGRFVPEGTMVEIQHYAMNHSSQHWHDPFAYQPERWLHRTGDKSGGAKGRDEKDADRDHLEAMQPFSVGPRNCVGRNLAYAEMRLILARIMFEFDLRLAKESEDWLRRAKMGTFWAKPPLYVYLTAATGG